MALSITSVTPTGVVNGVPSGFDVMGTVSNCDQLEVASTCSTDGPYTVVTSGASWSASIDNGKSCSCGDSISIFVTCIGGPAQRASASFTINCECPPGQYSDSTTGQCADCPAIAPPTVMLRGCGSGHVPPTASATITVSPPTGFVVTSYYWSVTLPSLASASLTGTSPTVSTNAGGWTGSGASGGAVDLTAPGSYSVAVVLHLAGDAGSCMVFASTPFTVPPCACPEPATTAEWTLSGANQVGPASFESTTCDNATIGIDFAVDPGQFQAGAISYTWDFGDGSPVVGPAAGPGAQHQQHTYTNSPSGQDHTYTVVVTVQVPGSSCPAFSRQLQIKVPGCSTPNGGETGGNGWFSLCCLLLSIWALLFLVTATLLYFELWPAAVISGALFLIVYSIWIFVCCRRCALRFWRCCVLLEWLYLVGAFTSATLFALLAAGWAGNGIVLAIYGAFVTILWIAIWLAGCGRTPIPFDPKTWPPCKCP